MVVLLNLLAILAVAILGWFVAVNVSGWLAAFIVVPVCTFILTTWMKTPREKPPEPKPSDPANDAAINRLIDSYKEP